MVNNKIAHISDESLIQHYYQSKDNKWLGILLQRYTLLLLGVGMKYLKDETAAQDCVQQVFIKALNYLPHNEVHNFKGWLYRVMQNECLMSIRQSKNKGRTSPIEEDAFNIIPDDTDITTDREIVLQWMEISMMELNNEQRECLDLFYLQEFSYQNIADKTGYTILQVKSYIQNGKRNLKLLIEKKRNKDVKG